MLSFFSLAWGWLALVAVGSPASPLTCSKNYFQGSAFVSGHPVEYHGYLPIGVSWVVGVLTTPGAVEMRQWVRKTVGRSLPVVFLSGSNPELAGELNQHNDMLLFDLEESYSGPSNSPSKKVIGFFSAILDNIPTVRFLIKIDHDTEIFDITNFTRTVASLPSPLYAGCIWGGGVMPYQNVHRDERSNHYVELEDYDSPFYPPYASGHLYALDREAADHVVRAAARYKPTSLQEDCWVGILLTKETEITARHVDFLYISDAGTRPDDCGVEDWTVNKSQGYELGYFTSPSLLQSARHCTKCLREAVRASAEDDFYFSIQDKLARHICGRKPRVLIVGANDGISEDRLMPAVLTRGWSGVLVEPSTSAVQRLQENIRLMFHGHIPPTLQIAKAAIVPENMIGRMPLFYHHPLYDQRASLKVASGPVRAEVVHAVTMAHVFEATGRTCADFDIVQINVQHLDYEILSQLDCSPHIVAVNIGERRAASVSWLQSRGYHASVFSNIVVGELKTAPVSFPYLGA